nr:BCCT family transporter [Halochromatium roseum]
MRHALPLAPRSLLYPLIGKRIHGPIGHAIDILATVGTLFGVATSLGLGAIQINAGLGRLSGVPQAETVQVAIIAVITLIATISVVTGVHRGIHLLSRLNLGLAGPRPWPNRFGIAFASITMTLSRGCPSLDACQRSLHPIIRDNERRSDHEYLSLGNQPNPATPICHPALARCPATLVAAKRLR